MPASEPLEPWPFDQPTNCAVFTTTHVMLEGEPILSVYHDEDDHGWQFHGARPTQMKYALLVSLKEVVLRDPSVCEVADLPPGWHARRTSASDGWVRKKTPGEGISEI
jgi:hypothetical protein